MISGNENGCFIETRGLARDYRVGPATVHALAGIDLQVRRAEFLAVLGVSGSGKSTLLQLLGGLDTPTAGSVLVDGRDLAGLNGYQRALYRRTTVGFVFQSYYLVPSLTAEENVALALTFQGTFGAEREPPGRRGHRPRGTAAPRRAPAQPAQRRRAATGGHRPGHRPSAAAAAGRRAHRKPRPRHGRGGRRAVGQIHRELGATVVVVTHDEEIVRHAADRLVHLRDGRLLREEGGPS